MNNAELAGKVVPFPYGYQRRSNSDLFKIFIVENRRSLRGYKRILLIGIPLILIWLYTKSFIALILMLPFTALIVIGLIGYSDIWRVRKKWEKEEIPRRAFVQERILKYGDYGLILKESDKTGQFAERYAWSRFGMMLEWERSLFLLPAKEKADLFILRADEIGELNFSEFRNFAKSKLNYKLISRYGEII